MQFVTRVIKCVLWLLNAYSAMKNEKFGLNLN